MPGSLPAELPLQSGGEMQTFSLQDSAVYADADVHQHAGWHMDGGVDPTPRHELYRLFHKRLMSVVADSDRQQILSMLADWAGRPPAVRDSHRQMTAAEIGALGEDGLIEIGGHTMTHPVLAHLPATAQTQEIRDGKAALEAITGTRVDAFAYPFGRGRYVHGRDGGTAAARGIFVRRDHGASEPSQDHRPLSPAAGDDTGLAGRRNSPARIGAAPMPARAIGARAPTAAPG